MLAGEDHLADSAFWNTKRVFRTDPLIANKMLEQLMLGTGIERAWASVGPLRNFYLDSTLSSD